jgi:hypothetical protein
MRAGLNLWKKSILMHEKSIKIVEKSKSLELLKVLILKSSDEKIKYQDFFGLIHSNLFGGEIGQLLFKSKSVAIVKALIIFDFFFCAQILAYLFIINLKNM